MDQKDRRSDQGLVFGLILLGVVARFVPHPPNVTPLTAIALFGGAYLPKAWGIGLPLLTIALSDLVIGVHDVIAFTWASVALTAVLGWWVRRRAGVRRLVGASLLGSTIFFLVTNFGVWLFGHGGTMYPKTVAGIAQCYVAAVPFYRNALLGDLIYTSAIFGLYAWASRGALLHAVARSR